MAFHSTNFLAFAALLPVGRDQRPLRSPRKSPNERKKKGKNKFSGRPPVSDAGAALGERFHLDLGEKRRVGGADFIFITHFSFAQFRSSFSSFFFPPKNLFPVGEAEKMQRRR